MRGHAFGGALLAVAVASGMAGAQGNDRSAPTGGRSALMGGTGVALARDGAAPFTNPATMGTIDDQRIAFSVNFFAYEITHFGGWNQPGPVNTSQFGAVHLNGAQDESSRFQGLPSTLCLFLTLAGLRSAASEGTTPEDRRRRQKLAFCIGSLELTNVNLTSLSFTGAAPGDRPRRSSQSREAGTGSTWARATACTSPTSCRSACRFMAWPPPSRSSSMGAA